MATSSKSATKSKTDRSTKSTHTDNGTDSVGELVGQILRNAAGEAVKGGSSLADTTKRVVAETVETLDERGPDLAKNAGILTWRYALLGWATWNAGKFVVKRRTRKTVKKARRKTSTALERS
jgi:hypothetical protein